MRERPAIQILLDRLRKQEDQWIRWGRWYHLAFGLLTVGANAYFLFRWGSLMQSFADVFKGADLKEAASTIYFMGLVAVGFGAILVLGFYSLSMAWRYWSGNYFRQALIACLEARDPRVDDTV